MSVDNTKEEVAQEVEEFDEDVFESMLSGTFEEEVDSSEADDTAEDNEYQEDTDQEEESEDDEELDEADDGELDEDLEDEEDDEEEDSLVDDNDSDDEDDDTEGEDEDSDEEDASTTDEDIDEGSEDKADTEGTSDGKSPATDGVDYKAFYDAVVNTEFVVNGKKVKGFSDPQKIIQSQQMAGGFSEKMAGFKQYRPFMAPLKERGMLEDSAKFDLAMNLIDGDVEAIKTHLKTLGVDPLDLDMDNVSYERKPSTASKESLVIEDTLERAKTLGIEDRVREVVGREWDPESFQEFVSNDIVRNDLLQHIETGAYDRVQDKMHEMSRLDFSGQFNSMNTISKYRAAVAELQREYQSSPQAQVQQETAPVSKPVSSVNAEKARIEQARKEKAYKEKVAKEEAKRTQQRKRASSMSKKSVKPKAKAEFDPMKVEGSELDELMNFLATGGRA